MKKTFDFYANVDQKDKQAFNDALPIGNGHIGAMIYGGACYEKLVLNENTFWLGNRGRKRFSKDFYKNYKIVQKLVLERKIEEAEKLAYYGLFPNPKQEAIYTTGGQLHIEFEKMDDFSYQRTIDLDQGIVTVEQEGRKNHLKRTYLASYPEDVLLVHLTSTFPIKIMVSLDREKMVDQLYTEKDEIHLMSKFNSKDEFHLCLKAKAEQVKPIGASLWISGKEITLYLAMATSIFTSNPKEYVKDRIISASSQEKDTCFEKAIQAYQSLFSRQDFECDDKDMTYFYQLSRYLMISCSRKNLPANLQGLWNQDIFPAWDSKFTINVNLEMNYWNVFAANLIECCEPYFQLLEKMYPNGKKLAKVLYHVDGFVAHHNTDIYGDCGLQDHYLPATLWPLGAAWLVQMVYEVYSYTKDIEYLKKYNYLLVDASKFLLNIMIEDERGYFVLCPSLSPENSYLQEEKRCHFSVGSVMDDVLIRDLFSKTIQVNELLKQNEELNQKLKYSLTKLYPFSKSKYNTLREWHEDYDEAEPGHRHISQLYALYPSFQIQPHSLEFELAKNTLSRRLEHGGGHTGWSLAWIIAMYTRLKDGDTAYALFQRFVKASTSRVGLDLHPPFQIDGNFGIAAAIKEMFIYDEEGRIEIFPAKPKSIKKLRFTNVLLRGNLKISIQYLHPYLTCEIEAKENCQIQWKVATLEEKNLSLKVGKNLFQYFLD